MRTVNPAVGGAELELRELRLVLNQVQRGEQLLGIHTIADRVGHCGHRSTSSVVVLFMGLCSRVACATRVPPPRFGSEMWRGAATGLSASLDRLQLEAGGGVVLRARVVRCRRSCSLA